MVMLFASIAAHNKQLQRTVIHNRWRAARAAFHCALACLGTGKSLNSLDDMS